MQKEPVGQVEGRRQSRLTVVPAVAVTLGFLVMGHLVSGVTTIHSSASVRFFDASRQPEPKAGADFSKESLGPLAVRFVRWSAAIGSGDVTLVIRVMESVSLALLGLLLFLFLNRLVSWPWALAGPALWVTHPQVFQRALYSAPDFTRLLFLLGPALLMGLALSCRRSSGRVFLCLLCGLACGLGLFVHHLVLWTSLALLVALFLTHAKTAVRKGEVSLGPLGFEFLAAAAAMGVTFLVCRSLMSVESKQLLGFLFGPFRLFHEPFSVNGTTYREVADGGPPWWTTCYLLLVRTPPLLVVGALAGAVAGWRARDRLLLVPLASAGTIFLVASLSGSPHYFPGENMLAALALPPVLLSCLALFRGFGSASRESGADRRRGLHGMKRAAGGALLVLLALGHHGFVNASHWPHQAAYANLLGGGTHGFLARGNDLFVEPTMDREAAALMISKAGPSGKVVVVPWGRRAQSVVDRHLHQLDEGRVQARDGGPYPTYESVGFSRSSPPFYHYCNESSAVASLTVDSYVLWMLCGVE